MKVEVSRLIGEKDYCEQVFNFFIKNKTIRKSNPNLFEKHLNKSLSNLEFGNFILLEHEYSIKEKLKNKSFYDWCVVIYYYTIYHSVLALVSKAGFESKNHIASICALIYIYYHKRNVLNEEDIQFIVDNLHIQREEIEFIASSKGLRERASYGVDESFDFSLAKKLQGRVVDFVNKVNEIFENEK